MMKKTGVKEINWSIRDTLALLVVPLEFYLVPKIAALSLVKDNSTLLAITPLMFKLVSLIIVAFLFRKLLVSDWRSFAPRWWLKLLICGVGVGAMYLILNGTRYLIGQPQSAEALQAVTGGLPYGVYLLSALTPALAPLTEEIIFRHILFYKFRNILPLCILMGIVSAFLFGVVHFNNFGGNLLLTVPYMVIALAYNLIYYFTKNIWYSLSIHFIFNFVQSFVPAILVYFLTMGL